MELLCEVTIPNYIRRILISQSRNIKYYEKGKKKRPDGKFKAPAYDYLPFEVTRLGKKVTVYFLANVKTKERVIANPRSAGTPKYKVINGQDLHRLTLMDYDRIKIINAIKKQMIEYVDKLEPIKKFPIRILCEIHDTIEDEYQATNPDWDVDNRFLFYGKVFQDTLSGSKLIVNSKVQTTTKQIIPDDHRGFITQSPTPLFVPIENGEERKLVFKIYHDDRPLIQSHPFYKDINFLHGEICPNCQGDDSILQLNNVKLNCPYCDGYNVQNL